MNDGKWIRDLKPDTPLTDAARHVLSLRLAVVREQLPLAKRASDRDPEHVHQLRVGTRRADAALRIFRPCLPGKAYRSARGRLRAIRRAAGAARDWDVFLTALRERLEGSDEPERAGLDFLIGYALGQRHGAQHSLDTVEQEADGSFAKFVSHLLDRIDLRASEDRAELSELARSLMPQLLQRLEQAAAEDLNDYDNLHQVRIAGKRLRYALEVLVGCFEPSLSEEIYPRIEEMQEVLGRANDSHVASQRLWRLREELRNYPDTWSRIGPGIERLLRFHQDRLVQQRGQFFDWWQCWSARSGSIA